MGWLDRLLGRFDADAGRWTIRGRSCGHETSLRKAGGGLRLGRWGYSLKLGRCPACGRLGLIEVYYKQPDPA